MGLDLLVLFGATVIAILIAAKMYPGSRPLSPYFATQSFGLVSRSCPPEDMQGRLPRPLWREGWGEGGDVEVAKSPLRAQRESLRDKKLGTSACPYSLYMLKLLLLLLASPIGSMQTHKADLFVSPSGNDANPGTSFRTPLATLKAAQVRARPANFNKAIGVRVWVKAGTYYLTKPLVRRPRGFWTPNSSLPKRTPNDQRGISHPRRMDALPRRHLQNPASSRHGNGPVFCQRNRTTVGPISEFRPGRQVL